MSKLVLFSIFVSFPIFLSGQQQIPDFKNLTAFRTEANIQIDAIFDEPDWKNAQETGDFIQYEPNPGIPASQKTIVKVLYDDKAIYIGATLFDISPDSILQQFSERDDIGITDWFALILDPYQDGLNGSGFIVTSAGVQYDTKYSAVGENNGGGVFSGDSNWDAVWDSQTRYTDEGWVVEMKIPYSAIRFPKMEQQLWNINFSRMVRRYREQTYWNEVKPEISGLLNQSGKLTAIQNIKSPVRLSATPFLVTYVENYFDKTESPKSSWGRSFNAGMDIKYGINDAFTLDMTLIPDFGQAQSDNQILNLSPFEVQFDENRQFFTEGTELFNKGNLFYSRRIGGVPLKYHEVEDQVGDQEEVVDNPLSSQLINATKISGRTKKGLGIGFFNATSSNTLATIKNIETNEKRTIETDPLTNYNILVLDQNLKNNSYLSFINTNVWRSGTAYEANVTGTEFSFRNKANSYPINGDGALNQKYISGAETENQQDSIGLGYSYRLELEKRSGNFQFGVQYSLDSRHYDINDLGINFQPNQKSIAAEASYNIFNPFGPFNRGGVSTWMTYSSLQEQNEFTSFDWNIRTFLVTKNFFGGGFYGSLQPFETFDYFEPRTGDFSQYYTLPKNGSFGVWGSSDYRKKFAYDFDAGVTFFDTPGRHSVELSFGPRFRVSDKFFLRLDIENEYLKNDEGYANPIETAQGYETLGVNDIIFSRRDQLIFDNTLSGNYIFSNKMSLTLRARHYWTRVKYLDFYLLEQNGSLGNTQYTGLDTIGNSLHNTSFNIFNIDMVYRWRFAPGSDIFFIWKNAIFKDSNDIEKSYLFNLINLLDAPQRNSFSFKIVYFLDYLDIKSKT